MKNLSENKPSPTEDIGAILKGLNIEDRSNHYLDDDTSQNTLDFLKKRHVKTISKMFDNVTEEVTVIDEEDMNKEIKTAPWKAAILASFAYSASQLSKEKKTSCIGCSTIFLIVFIASFICVFM